MEFLSASARQTFNIAKKLATTFTGGEVVLLKGRLGAGKTVFCKGLAAGLKIKHEVTSPTFTIMNVYEGGRLRFCHCDAYRLSESDFEITDYAGEKDTVTAIEWPENLGFKAAGRVIEVRMEVLGGNKRGIVISAQ